MVTLNTTDFRRHPLLHAGKNSIGKWEEEVYLRRHTIYLINV